MFEQVEKIASDLRSGRLKGVFIDSRKVVPNSLFVAINSGYLYAEDALKKGASIVAVEKVEKTLPAEGVLRVGSTKAFLIELAKACRRRFNGKLIGITGSSGKTTVKDMLAFALSQLGERCSCSIGNYNNEIGLPLSVCNCDYNDEIWVLELGISRPNDMDLLVDIAMPDVAVITNIGPSHTEFLGDERGVWIEKSKIARYADVLFLSEQARPFYEDIGLAGFNGKVVFSPQDEGGLLNESLVVRLLSYLLSRDVKIDWSGFKSAPHRFEIIENDGRLIVDDSYNANPLSMQASLRRFTELAGRKKRILLVLADMLELGENMEEMHLQVLKLAKSLLPNADFILVGDVFNRVAQGVVSDLIPFEGGSLRRHIREYDAVFLKGSNRFRLWEMV